MDKRARDSEAGSGAAVAADVNISALLEQILEATDHLTAGLNAAGMNQSLLTSSAYILRSLDRSLPAYTVEELLLTFQAFATVTAPSALAMDDLGQIRDEAMRMLRLLTTLRASVHGRRRLTGSTTVGVNVTFLQSAFSKPEVRDALIRLLGAFTELASIGADKQHKRRPLAIGVGYFIPGTVLITTLGLIFFLLTSIAFATGQIAISSNGVNVTALSNAIQQSGAKNAQATATAVPQPTATPTPRPIPTASRSATATPNTSATPTLSVSKSTVQPCLGTPDSFTLIYANGSTPARWTASWQDTTNIALSPASGTLQTNGSGRSTTITVTLVNDGSFTGTITITTNNNLTQTVTYDSTGC